MLPRVWISHLFYQSSRRVPQCPALHMNICKSLRGEGRAAEGLSPKLIYSSAHNEFILWWFRIWSLCFSRMAPNFRVLLFLSLSPQQPRNPASLLRGIWARKHSVFFMEANILILLTLHISAGIVSGLPDCVWAGTHLRNSLYPAFHFSAAAYFGHLQSVLCSAACLALLSEGLLALVGLSGVQCEVSILLKRASPLPCFWTILHLSILLGSRGFVLEWNLSRTEVFYCALRLCDFNNCCPTSLYFWEGKKLGSFKFLKYG